MALQDVAIAKVARIVSDHEIALNMGTDQGIAEEDIVTLNNRVEIKDPDTNELLGAVLVARLKLRVTLVDDRYCVAKVTDHVDADPGKLFGVKRFKRLTNNPIEETRDVVVVRQGEPAVIRRDVAEEPPF